MTYKNTVYIVKYRITLEKLNHMIKEKINKKITNGNKLTLQVIDSHSYPSSKSCNSFQQVWLSDSDSIIIEYKNVEKWKQYSESKEIWSEKIEENEYYLFQQTNDSNVTEILINFKYENIIQAINILIVYVHESITHKNFFSAKFNNKSLEIWPPEIGVDKEEDSLEGCFVMIEENKFLDTILQNIKDKNTISIITRDWNDFNAIAGLSFHYESYDYDENYLSNKEYTRLEKIENEKNTKQ